MKMDTRKSLIVGILLIIFIQPYFEMRAFNRFSEQKATYWDALFVELRIEANGARGDTHGIREETL